MVLVAPLDGLVAALLLAPGVTAESGVPVALPPQRAAATTGGASPLRHRGLQAQNCRYVNSTTPVNESMGCYPDQFCNGDIDGESHQVEGISMPSTRCEECNNCYGLGCDDCGLTEAGITECQKQCTDLCAGCGGAIATFLLTVLVVLVSLCCLAALGGVGCCYLCNKDQHQPPMVVGAMPVPGSQQQQPVMTIAAMPLVATAVGPQQQVFAAAAAPAYAQSVNQQEP